MSTTLRTSTIPPFNSFDMAIMNNCTSTATDQSPNLTSSRTGGILKVLGDSEGVKLFNSFLCMKNAGHLLDFWFACKGFRTNVDPNNPDRLFQIAKVIYRTYIKSGADHAVPLPCALKHDIGERMSSYHKGYKSGGSQGIQNTGGIDRTLFDAAQENVGLLLERTFYPKFLEFMKQGLHCGSPSAGHLPLAITGLYNNDTPCKHCLHIGSPKSKSKSRKKSSRHLINEQCEDSHPTTNPTGLFSPLIVHPGNKKHGKLPTRMTTSWANTSIQSPVSYLNQAPTSFSFQDPASAYDMDCSQCVCSEWDRFCNPPFSSPAFTTLSTAENFVNKDHVKSSILSPEQTEHHKTTTFETCQPTVVSVVPEPCGLNPEPDHWPPSHPVQSSTMPDTEALRVTSSIFGKKKSVLERSRIEPEPAKPRQNLAETDPAAFVLLLTNRLEKVKESRGKMEKLLSWVNQVDEKNAVDTNCSVSGNDPMADDLSCVPITESNHIDHPSDCSPPMLNAGDNTGRFKTPPETAPDACVSKHGVCEWTTRTLDPLAILPVEEDPQGILDEHCSRIWADEQDSTLAPEIRGGFIRPSVDSNYTTQELCHNPTLQRARGTVCDSPESRLATRRHTPWSVAPVPSSHTAEDPTKSIHKVSRRKSSIRTGNRSDARSTASWDSGVVTHCPYPTESSFLNSTLVQGELETRSIVAAASLQALSSSTTELAMVNSEVTAKLVEHMTRHYRRNVDSDPVVQHSTDHPFNTKTSSHQNCSPPACHSVHHHHHPYTHQHIELMSGKPLFAGPSAITGSPNPANCIPCIQNAWRPCTYHAIQVGPIQPNRLVGPIENQSCKSNPFQVSSINSHSFPTTSDTSSTFDSGISSTYDQLPLTLSQGNGDRGSRSQSLRNWQATYRESSGPQVNARQLRTPSAPRSQYHTGMHLHPPGAYSHSFRAPSTTGNGYSHPRNYYQSTGESASDAAAHHPALLNTNCPHQCNAVDCCTCSRNVAYESNPNTDVNRKNDSEATAIQPSGRPARGGQLLQHWLYLQTCQSFGSDETPSSSSQTRASHSRKQHGHHHHHHRRSSTHHRHSSKQTGSSPVGRNGATSTAKDQSVRQHEPTSCSRPICSLDSAEPVSGATNGLGLIVGYYLCDDPVPYRTVWTGTQTSNSETENQAGSTTAGNSLTLGQFKQLIAKKGSYRFFFKKPSNEFGTGVVHEELTQDDAIIPLWDGKVVARIERAE